MTIVLVFQIILSVLLIGTIMLQSQTGGLGSALGTSTSFHTKRGLEKGMFYFTIILSILFTGTSILVLTF